MTKAVNEIRENIFGESFCSNYRQSGCLCDRGNLEDFADGLEEEKEEVDELEVLRQSMKEMAQLKNIMDGCPTKGKDLRGTFHYTCIM